MIYYRGYVSCGVLNCHSGSTPPLPPPPHLTGYALRHKCNMYIYIYIYMEAYPPFNIIMYTYTGYYLLSLVSLKRFLRSKGFLLTFLIFYTIRRTFQGQGLLLHLIGTPYTIVRFVLRTSPDDVLLL